MYKQGVQERGQAPAQLTPGTLDILTQMMIDIPPPRSSPFGVAREYSLMRVSAIAVTGADATAAAELHVRAAGLRALARRGFTLRGLSARWKDRPSRVVCIRGGFVWWKGGLGACKLYTAWLLVDVAR